jgi:hypothetical protein
VGSLLGSSAPAISGATGNLSCEQRIKAAELLRAAVARRAAGSFTAVLIAKNADF